MKKIKEIIHEELSKLISEIEETIPLHQLAQQELGYQKTFEKNIETEILVKANTMPFDKLDALIRRLTDIKNKRRIHSHLFENKEPCKVLVVDGHRGDIHCGEEVARLAELAKAFPNMHLDDPKPGDKMAEYTGPKKQIKIKVKR